MSWGEPRGGPPVQGVTVTANLMRPPSQEELGDPQWVMLGTANPNGGVTIYASTELTGAQMRANIVLGRTPPGLLERAPMTVTYDIGARMVSVVVVTAPTYGEAFRLLFAQWSPDPEPLALDPPPA